VLVRDFSFEVPPRLIAQRPTGRRGAERLLVLDRARDGNRHTTMAALPELLPAGSVLVLNDSRVRKARVYGSSENGGAVELVFLEEIRPGRWRALARRARRQRVGKRLLLPDGVEARVVAVHEDQRELELQPPIGESYFERHGSIPLPPYIERAPDEQDDERYQTIYARESGSAAAPTAGLHLTPEILGTIRARGIDVQCVTLHVGAGTFQPIRSERLEDHHMHEESVALSPQAATAIESARRDGREVVAVGTTVVRALESRAASRHAGTGVLAPGQWRTDLFIRPGHRFRVVTRLLTNLHTPGSTLVALVAAFAGRERLVSAYEEAVAHGYRFFSYGDAMLIL
jgi:S-adenosylmethionine:tRNA ribosyltransferase-isomerase